MGTEEARYPRRLIEVDLPLEAISQHATDARSVHHGHITAIHIWWARKPLPACRGAFLALGLPDPVDPLCPESFRQRATEVLQQLYGTSAASSGDHALLRRSLIRLVSDFSSWELATIPAYLDAARDLLATAHHSLYRSDGPPLAADSFSGGGSMPLEALRVGASVYASDLNPVAALISKVTLEYVQVHRERLFEEIAVCSQRISEQARAELAALYPDAPGSRSLASLWFRTIRCEGPKCGADVLLTSKFHLSRSSTGATVGLRVVEWSGPSPVLEIAEGPQSSFPAATVRRGAASCLRCGYTMPVERVRAQLTALNGGASTATLVAVVARTQSGGLVFRAPSTADRNAVATAIQRLKQLETEVDGLAILPDELLPPMGTLGFRVQRYGMLRWRDLFTPRQLVTLSTLSRLVRATLSEDREAGGLGIAVRAYLALAVDRLADYHNTGCSWNPSGSALPHLFTRQALPIIWDYGEANPFGGSAGDWDAAVEHVLRGLRNALVSRNRADVGRAAAQHHPLPSDCAHLLITDPPYYDAIPYADLSDFFYVWLRRMLHRDHPDLFKTSLVPREDECVMNTVAGKDRAYYRKAMTSALAEARRVTRPDGVGVVVFAHKSTAGWEDLLAAMLEAGWIITASWPIDTENATRLRARNSAVLASSVHLVCRPRERRSGELIMDTVGDWRDVLSELPQRIHDWMPRLAAEGVVGADAIFACLGPALEVFSRYARVEKASGERVLLQEYLEHVWAQVSKEALSSVFSGADPTGFEPDARLTAMWLWTLSTRSKSNAPDSGADTEEAGEENDESDDQGSGAGYALEFDTARKIAQGLGAKLDALPTVVEVNGNSARLLTVRERSAALIGRDEPRTRKKVGQLAIGFNDSANERTATGESPAGGSTVLDRVHQAMLLFAGAKADGVKRFVVDEGVGQDQRFWRLSQALAALYPPGSHERRWAEGVLARKKSLGF